MQKWVEFLLQLPYEWDLNIVCWDFIYNNKEIYIASKKL